MADKTGEQRRAHEGDDTGSQRSGLETQSQAQVRSFFFTVLTFITYKLRHTCHCTTVHHHHHRRLVSHVDDHTTHQNGFTLKANVGPRRPTQGNRDEQPMQAHSSQRRLVPAPMHPDIPRNACTITRTRVSYIHILLLYLLLLFLM